MGGTDLPLPNLCDASFPVGGQDHEGGGIPSFRGEQCIQVSRLPDLVESTQGPQDSLATFAIFPLVLHYLQVGIPLGLLSAEKHGGLPSLTPCIIPSLFPEISLPGLARKLREW